MANDFLPIGAHGIFRKADILKIIPAVDVVFFAEVIPPNTSTESFMFNIVKHSSINLDIHMLSHDKKGDTQVITDNSNVEEVTERHTLTEEEVYTLFYGKETPSEKISQNIKDYKRRLIKIDSYNAQKAALESSDKSAPDYAGTLSALELQAPSDSTMRKQSKCLKGIEKKLNELIDEIVEAYETEDDADETEAHALIQMFDSEDSKDAVEYKATLLIRSFYTNKLGGYIDDEEDFAEDDPIDSVTDNFNPNAYGDITGETLAEQFRENAAQAVARGQEIRNNPNTITNAVEKDSPEDSPESSPTDSPEGN